MKAAKTRSPKGTNKKPTKGRAARKYVFPVIIEKDEDGFFAVCPSLQGCYTQGDTLEEVQTNIADAVRLHVESRLEHGEEVPEYEIFQLTTVEVKV